MTLAATLELLEPTNVNKTRDALLSARHLDGTFYTSRDVEALEKQRIFMKEWLFLAREEEELDQRVREFEKIQKESFAKLQQKTFRQRTLLLA